jgi:hypothetical protein
MKLREDISEYKGSHKQQNDSEGYHESLFIFNEIREFHGLLLGDGQTGVGQLEAILIIVNMVLSKS